MTLTPSDAAGRDGNRHRLDSDRTLETWFGARARRTLGMVALLVLVTWLAVGGGQSTGLSPDPADSHQSLERAQQPVLDGRGKWTGYLPY